MTQSTTTGTPPRAAPQQDDASAVAARVDELLGKFDTVETPGVREAAEDLVATIMRFYGAGIERITTILAEHAPGAELLDRLAADELVGGLFALHDLHPLPVRQRVSDALDSVRPYLGSHSGDVELLDIDEEGVVRLRLKGNCDGCPSSAVTVKLAIEDAVRKAAPEIADIAVEGMAQPETTATGPGGRPLLPLASESDNGGSAVAETAEWVNLDELVSLSEGELTSVGIGGASVLVCNVAGSLYAYRDRCPACDTELGRAELHGGELRCPGCARSYDVRLAGREERDSNLHLEPLPLLADHGGVRLAVPEVAR
ncbi:NifU family protein [Actinopolyspora sp. H202]|uniref:NifU family protein n=1 Tax=Actinopolyspora sp. H202 TaxID=1500456 RepID=UPI003EE6FD5C